uniref:UPF0690 protein C1orf52 homolog B-like n=1 Tax=Phallusia mammillata TaxID=59560 RepID=A0A6F9D8M3_9ASCI|nr:UPF0690 protein C1orf52 homolog B-like [Phallusia mammillata]
MASDPLSFFAVASSDDDQSSDEETTVNNATVPTSAESRPDTALPPPLTALASAKTPEFVTSHLSGDMDWNRMVKKAPYVVPKEYKPWETALPPVETKSSAKDKKPDIALVKQVPQTLIPPKPKPEVPKPAKEIVDHAIMWSKMYQNTNEGGPVKRPRPEDEDADLAGFCHTDTEIGKVAFQFKHQKTETFREKEKRKRNQGQANREKMFVEEEKRVLRQSAENF